jgi:hypothetical protein
MSQTKVLLEQIQQKQVEGFPVRGSHKKLIWLVSILVSKDRATFTFKKETSQPATVEVAHHQAGTGQ